MYRKLVTHQALVTAMRHGPAKYNQQEVDLADANDLTEEGVVEVRQSVERLILEIDRRELIEVRSSPFGRTLQTAKILVGELQKRGFTLSQIDNRVVANSANVIYIDHDIKEVLDFNLELFLAFLYGREVNGTQIVKDNTNPNDLSFSEYFNKREWEDADAPSALIKELNKTERPEDTSARFEAKLRQITERRFDLPTRVVLVTHQGLMKKLSEAEVNPSDFFTVNLSDFL